MKTFQIFKIILGAIILLSVADSFVGVFSVDNHAHPFGYPAGCCASGLLLLYSGVTGLNKLNPK